MATINLGRIKPVWKNTWTATTAYVVDDIVRSGVTSYICINAHTSAASFAVGSDWQIMSQGSNVGFGTAGQVLKTNSAGNGTEWGTGSSINGGTKRTYTSGGKNYESRTFLGSGDINFPDDQVIDFFMIGAGGAGGNYHTTNGNGGGGAGGAVEGINYTISAGSYNIKVGVGTRAPYASAQGAGDKGEPSIFGSFIAKGGGGGMTSLSNIASNSKSRTDGGCGGGGNYMAANNGGASTQDGYGSITGVTGYGFAGGANGVTYCGAGGGGIGSQGVNGAASGTGGDGGQGRACSFKDGTTIYYGGGGGGGSNSSEHGGTGYHGAGRGWGQTTYYSYTDTAGLNNQVVNSTSLGSSGLDAFDNTGSGGGAGSYWQGTYLAQGGGSGGSGIVIIRWEV